MYTNDKVAQIHNTYGISISFLRNRNTVPIMLVSANVYIDYTRCYSYLPLQL